MISSLFPVQLYIRLLQFGAKVLLAQAALQVVTLTAVIILSEMFQYLRTETKRLSDCFLNFHRLPSGDL